MKDTKRLTAIMTTAILISLMASSLVASADTINNYNVNMGTTSAYPSYLATAADARAFTADKYGALVQPAYEWWSSEANGGQRTGFNPGPAPDRPEIVYTTNATDVCPKVILGQVEQTGTNITGSTISAMSNPGVAMGGKLIGAGTLRLSNGTTRTALVARDPFSTTVYWASIVGFGPTSGASIGGDGPWRIDDTHIAALGGGVSMWTTDGKFLWRDNAINPGAVYHSEVMICDEVNNIRMCFGPRTITGNRVPWCGGWDLSSPDTDKSEYNATGAWLRTGRSLWNYTMDEPGNPMMCYADGNIIMGSYSSYSLYALNATTGAKSWETFMPFASGYSGCSGDGKVFVGCQACAVTCVNSTTGEVIWRNTDGYANRAFNVYNFNYAYGRVYTHDLGSGRTGAETCFDGETGKMLWAARELHNIGYYTTVVGGGKVYGNQADGSTTTGRTRDPTNFCCWDAFTGEVIWNLRMSITKPQIMYGSLYFIVSSSLYCVSTALKPQDWTMFRGNVENPGVTLSGGPTNLNIGPKWTFTTGAGVMSSPAIVDGKVYINSNDRHVYCLDAYNGSLIWKFLTNEPRMTTFGSSPAVVNGKVIIGPDDGYIYALNAKTGALLWKVDAGPYKSIGVGLGQFNTRSSPIIYQDKIYVGSCHSNKTYCITLDGHVDWSTDLGAEIVGSAAIEQDYIYIQSFASRMYKLNMTGGIILNFSTPTSGGGGFGFGESAYTPVVVGNTLYMGTAGPLLRAFNVTTWYNATTGWVGNGTQMFGVAPNYGVTQPYVMAESSNGAWVYVPDSMLTARNSSGYSFTTTGGKLIGPAGPTVACARADNGSNLWSDWGGWEVYSSVLFSGWSSSAVIYYGSDSYAIRCTNASGGEPISWFTTGGSMPGSPALWDGKLYQGSADNKLYCFEDHDDQNTAISMSLDKTTVDLNNTESLTVTAQLTHVPSVNVYEEIGRAAPIPPMPNSPIIVTFTKPDGTEVNVTATTDLNGRATVTYTPNAVGTWKVIAWYAGIDLPTYSYGYAFSDQVPIEAKQTITAPEKPTEPTGTNIPMEYVYAAIAVIVIVIVAAAALMLLRRRKK